MDLHYRCELPWNRDRLANHRCIVQAKTCFYTSNTLLCSQVSNTRQHTTMQRHWSPVFPRKYARITVTIYPAWFNTGAIARLILISHLLLRSWPSWHPSSVECVTPYHLLPGIIERTQLNSTVLWWWVPTRMCWRSETWSSNCFRRRSVIGTARVPKQLMVKATIDILSRREARGGSGVICLRPNNLIE
jgi:hypothetical protein